MSNDPISQLPEPYRIAWGILHEPFDHELIFRSVLTYAQKLANASWGMMILETDIEGFEFTVPGYRTFPVFHTIPSFRTLPHVLNVTIPVGYISSLAYALARKVMRDGQNVLIADTNHVVEIDINGLMDEFLPLPSRENIAKLAAEKLFAHSFLEIPSIVPFSAMVLPIKDGDKNLGAIYLHRPLHHVVFAIESLKEVQIFLSSVAIGIRNARDIGNAKHLALHYPYTLSSELRDPLINILGDAQFLLDQSIKHNKNIDERRNLKRIDNNAHQALKVLNALLLHARIEQNLIHKQGADIKAMIDSAIWRYRSAIEAKNQSLVLDIPDSLDVMLVADDYINAVVDTFVNNAHIYTPAGGEIKISGSVNNDIFRFSVSDNGPGLTEDEISNLFQRHYRSQRDEIRKVPGLGVELYLAKRLIELWGGQIGAEGSPNQGSTFWFTLPVKKQ